VASGALHVTWHAPYESYLDEMGHRLLGEARRIGARRVFIDGIGSFRQSMIFPGRLRSFFSALSMGLRAAGATTLCALAAREFLARPSLVLDDISAVAENVVLLRLAEHRSRLARLLSVIKVRQSGFDPAVVPFEIGGRGIAVGEPPADAAPADADVHRPI
jgi:circadian clock protein KaiC